MADETVVAIPGAVVSAVDPSMNMTLPATPVLVGASASVIVAVNVSESPKLMLFDKADRAVVVLVFGVWSLSETAVDVAETVCVAVDVFGFASEGGPGTYDAVYEYVPLVAGAVKLSVTVEPVTATSAMAAPLASKTT